MRSRGWLAVSAEQEPVVAYRALLRTVGDLIARVCELEEEPLTRERFVAFTPLLHGWPRARVNDEMPQHCQAALWREVQAEADRRFAELEEPGDSDSEVGF